MKIPQRGFTEIEFASRCSKIQAAMDQMEVEALLLTTKAEIQYFTGFMTQFWQSPTRPWFAVIPLSGKPIAVIPSIGAQLMQQCYVGEIISWTSPHESDDGVSLVSDVIRQQMNENASLGMLMGRETSMRMPMSDFFELRKCVGNINIKDMTAMVQQIRMIKSPDEQKKLRYVCGLVSEVFDNVPNWLTSGKKLNECFKEFKIDALQHGVDDVSYLVGSAGAGGYQDIIAPPTTKTISRGDIIMMDTGCVWDGYFSDFDRNFSVGSASQDAQDAHKKLFDATEAALELLRPGVTSSELFTIMDKILRPGNVHDTDSVGRYGHGLGIQLTEPPSHSKWDKTEIKPGMVLTIEPSLNYGSNFLMVAEENILVHENGVELLSRRSPRELMVI